MSIVIQPVSNKGEMETFIKFPWRIYKGDANWIPPLLMERRDAFNRSKNPVFTHLDADFFLAMRNGEVVGRISAQVDHEHNRIHEETTGFFGAFEAVNDKEVAVKTPLILHDLMVGIYRIQYALPGYESHLVKIDLGVAEFKPVVVKLQLIAPVQ